MSIHINNSGSIRATGKDANALFNALCAGIDARKPIALERPLVVFDIESTGVDVSADRIITLAALRVTPADLFAQTQAVRQSWMVNPGFPIPPSSTRIHGLTDAMVAGCPHFAAVAPSVMEFVSGADLCGYNARNFDLPLLWEELFRAGLNWNLEGVRLVDAHEIFRRKEPRDLSAAVRKFCGRKHEGAHSALADAEATWQVLNGELAAYPDLRNATVQGLHDFCNAEELEGQPATRLDLAGLIVRTADGVARYTLKKVRGVAVEDDPGFGAWMLRNSFPAHTKSVLRELLHADNEI
jgi:DNA polymerase III subunit epsilon